MFPRTAKTFSSSVNDVHTWVGNVEPIGVYFLYTALIMRPLMPPALLIASMNTCVVAFSSPWLKSTNCLIGSKSTIATPTLMSLSVTPCPSVLETGPVGAVAVVVGVDEPPDDLLLLPHAASAMTSANPPTRTLARMVFPLSRASRGAIRQTIWPSRRFVWASLGRRDQEPVTFRTGVT